MSTYYRGKRAKYYNTRWHTYTEKTLAETLAMIDVTALRSLPERLGRLPRLLVVACGTGILLRQLLDQVPGVEAYGVDASEDKLVQARTTLKDWPHVHVERVQIGTGEIADLPSTRESFDLITCTNALHDMPEPAAMLAGLGRLLAPGGQLVVEDFAPREPRFFWAAFEWLLQRIEGSSVHAYTMVEAHTLCQQAGLCVASENVFTVDLLWHGWVVRAYRTASEAGLARS